MNVITRSRAAALAGLGEAIERGGWAILLTGEAGAGKSWLLERLVEAQSGRRIWIRVAVSPGARPGELLEEIARRMGIGGKQDRGASQWRSAIESLLLEVQVEGRRMGLIVEEVHLGGPETLETIRQVASRIHRPEGFDAIILSAQTGLLPRLELRALASLDAVVGKRLHLRPLDADEAESLCTSLLPPQAKTTTIIEELHRDARGNPARLLRLAQSLSGRLERGRGRVHRGDPGHVLWPPEPARTGRPSPRDDADPDPGTALIPARPPLKEAEGMIEVGWEADEPWPQPGSEKSGDESMSAENAAQSDAPSEEPILDRYARLQAEAESTRAAQSAPELLAHVLVINDEQEHADAVDPALDQEPGVTRTPAQIWAEQGEQFAPYGNLFAPRAPQSRNDP
jgi:type II secretory pathway predicted ATPase ExeA